MKNLICVEKKEDYDSWLTWVENFYEVTEILLRAEKGSVCYVYDCQNSVEFDGENPAECAADSFTFNYDDDVDRLALKCCSSAGLYCYGVPDFDNCSIYNVLQKFILQNGVREVQAAIDADALDWSDVVANRGIKFIEEEDFSEENEHQFATRYGEYIEFFDV